MRSSPRPAGRRDGRRGGRPYRPGRRGPRVAGRPPLRHPQLRRHHAARRGQRRAARGRPGARGSQRRPDQRRGLLDRRHRSPGTSRRCRHPRGAGPRVAAGRRRPRPPPGRRRPAPARGRDVPPRLQPEGRLEHARHDLARNRAPGGVRPRGRPAGQRALRRAHRHRRGGRGVVTGIHGQPLHTEPRTASSPPRTRPPTHACWRSSRPLAERSSGVQAALTGRTR